ncbi:hypothetical protein AB0M46_06455 [Dactylosporangium sp. NPDC051485]|uniref:hypothetical protein n=1 Tax=Dactylosporangium sp. NPDC051485 TaxID=3154846 RepID=UPI00343487A7
MSQVLQEAPCRSTFSQRVKQLRRQLPDAFRLPTGNDPRPANRQIATVCAWAAALGLGGMAVALRAFVGLVAEYRGWYAPTVVTIGLLGLACTIGAFASVHRRRLPFALLGVASASLLTGWIVTGL